jgi:hypothetical protein
MNGMLAFTRKPNPNLLNLAGLRMIDAVQFRLAQVTCELSVWQASSRPNQSVDDKFLLEA